MKQLVSLLLVILITTVAHAQLKTPAPSPGQTIKQDFALSSIEVSYSRPLVKGRKIFGDLVPYGQVWRTGANAATTLTFGDEVIINGTTIPAGKYGLLSIPGKTSWTLIISKQTNVTSPSAYKQEEDVVKIMLKPQSLPFAVENFTIFFENVKAESCDITLTWDKTYVTLPIKAEVDGKIMAAIHQAMASDKPPYFQAGVYFLENNKDPKQAAEWLAKAVDAQGNAYWVRYQYAKALAKIGKKAEAKEAALQSKELALAAKNDDYVKLNEKLIAALR